MNPITSSQRTLGELRGELAARLGFGQQGQAAQAQRGLLNAFLQEATVAAAWQAAPTRVAPPIDPPGVI